MNGEEKKLPSPVPPLIQELMDNVPHFGDAWEQRTFVNPEKRFMINMLIPPERSGLLEKPKFFSQVQIMTNRGPADLGFVIPNVSTISEAEAGWRHAAQEAIREMHENLQKNSRRIVLPGANDAPIPGLKKH